MINWFRRTATPVVQAGPSTAAFTDLSHFDSFNTKQFDRLPRSLRRDILSFRKARMTLRLGQEISIIKGRNA